MTQEPPEALEKLITAYQDFSFKFLSQLLERDPDKNVVVSPFSIAIALVMLYNAARGETQQAIAKVLGLEELSLEEINTANQWLLSTSNDGEAENELLFANSLWVKSGISLNEDFVRHLKEAYTSEVASLDFSSSEAEGIVNRWVAEKMQNKIQQLIDRPLENSILILLNALYFKGIWAETFDKELTKEGTFHLADGRSISHPMMEGSREYLYHENEKFQAICLPYIDADIDGSEGISMYIFLPRPAFSIEEFKTCLSLKNWKAWMRKFFMTEVDLVLPRFKVEYGQLLNDILSDLGMGEAFSISANFEGIGAVNLQISQVIHKATIEVNEEGTEAAAATAMIAEFGVWEPPHRFEMTVDRPFFYAIFDARRYVFLFMGCVLNPA